MTREAGKLPTLPPAVEGDLPSPAPARRRTPGKPLPAAEAHQAEGSIVLPTGAEWPRGRGLPEADRPKNGWPMRLAIFGLASERWRENARLYYDLEPTLSADLRTNNPARRLLWNDLVEQAQARPPALIFRGQRAGTIETIDPEILQNAHADFEVGSVTSGTTVFHSVSVWPAAEWQNRNATKVDNAVQAPPTAPAPAAPPKKSPRAATVSYAQQDRPLLEKMRGLRKEGKANTDWEAACAVANEAAGGGQFQSKAKRLLTAYRKAFSTERF